MQKITITTLLGSLLACTLYTTVLAKPPVTEQPSLEKRVWRLEQGLKKLQQRVEALEESWDIPVCPCFMAEEIEALPLEDCEVTTGGTFKSKGPEVHVVVDKGFCAIRTPKGSFDLPITPQEQWACIQPVLNKMTGQALRCPVTKSDNQ
jgi:hypothetical protein